MMSKSAEDQGVNRVMRMLAEAPGTSADEQRKLHMSIAGMVARSAGDAASLVRKGAVPRLWASLAEVPSAVHPLSVLGQANGQGPEVLAGADVAACARIATTCKGRDPIAALALLRQTGLATLSSAVRGAAVGAVLQCLDGDRENDVLLGALTALMALCASGEAAVAAVDALGMDTLLAIADHKTDGVRTSVALAVGRVLGAVPEDVRSGKGWRLDLLMLCIYILSWEVR
jgi:hypothetical protein